MDEDGVRKCFIFVIEIIVLFLYYCDSGEKVFIVYFLGVFNLVDGRK